MKLSRKCCLPQSYSYTRHQTDRRTDGRIIDLISFNLYDLWDGWTNGWADRHTDTKTNRQTYSHYNIDLDIMAEKQGDLIIIQQEKY